MRSSIALAAVALLASEAAQAQFPLNLPRPSPRAKVEQQVGLTDLSITYSRPAVNKRKVWGGIVKYGEVWRAGANENTVFSTSSDATVEGQPLPAGAYGVHMIPAEGGAFTVIFSKVNTMWGSFGYDQKEDQLRVQVRAQPAEHTERLEWGFDEPDTNATTASLRWEKLRVPIRVQVSTPQVVVESLRKQLRGGQQFDANHWANAANYCLRNNVNLDEATRWVDRSIRMRPNYQNQLTKAGLLEKSGGSGAEVAALREKALAAATEAELNQFGYQLLGENKTQEAISIFQQNVKRHPESWNVYDSLGEAYEKAGDKRAAAQHYGKALSLVKDVQQKERIEKTLTTLQ